MRDAKAFRTWRKRVTRISDLGKREVARRRGAHTGRHRGMSGMLAKSVRSACGTALAISNRGRHSSRHRTEESAMNPSKMKIVYVISERNSKHYWNRVGVAFVNNDGSINVKLDAVPVSGELQIRDYVAKEDGVGPFARASNGQDALASNGQDTLAEIA
jgi:hypothetical protein